MPRVSIPRSSVARTSCVALTLAACAAISAPFVRADEEPPAKGDAGAAGARFPREWFWAAEEKDWRALQKMAGAAAKPLTVKSWKGEPQDIGALRGKIVLIDFWATWCPPCRALIPVVNDVAAKYQEKGLIVFGVCNTQGANDMGAVADKHGMKYPTAADANRRTENAYGVRWWPFFVLIDREGLVRAAGLHPDHLSDAIDALLREQPAKS